MLSQIFFILLNYGLHIFLARKLGVEKYGQFGIVMSIITIIISFLYKAISETEAKLVSASPDKRFSVLATALRIQLVLSGIITICIISGSKLIVNFLNAPSIYKPLMIGSISIILYSVLGAFFGVLVGLRKFGILSFVTVINSATKTALIAIFVLAGFGLSGAFAGYSISIIPGLIICIMAVGLTKPHGHYKIRNLLNLLIPLSIINLINILFQNIDLLLVQILLYNEGKTGIYTSAQTVAKLLPIVFASFSTTILPSISMALGRNDINQFRLYVRQAIRYLFLLLSPLVAIVAAFSEKISVFLFSIAYKDAGTPLSILIVSMAFLSILLVLSAIVIGSGNGWIGCKLLLVTLVIVVIFDLICIPRFELVGAASASACGFLFGCILFYAYLSKKWGHFIDFFPLCIMVGTASLIFITAKKLPLSDNSWIFAGPALFIGYFIILIIFRVLNKEDLKVIQNIFRINKLAV